MKAYAQLLESYRSLTLAYMAGTFVIISPELMSLVHILFVFFPDAFGVTEAYMDQELCRFIASGRLHAKIDKVGLTLTWMVLADHLSSDIRKSE